MATVVSIVNQKGGVGKTTTSINLGYALALAGKRVLLVDMDPQAALSEGVGVYLEDRGKSLFAVMTEEREIEEILIGLEVEGETGGALHLAPAEENMAGLEAWLMAQVGREQFLADALDSVLDDYDFVLIDCGPSLQALTANAVTASDYLIVPVLSQRAAQNATRRLMGFYNRAKKSVNGRVEILGVLLTQVDRRTRGSAEVCEQVRDSFGKRDIRVFGTEIRVNTTLAEVPNRAVSIFDYDPRSRGAADYRGLAKEVLDLVR